MTLGSAHATHWSERLRLEFDAADARAIAVAGGLTSEQLNWRRTPAEWSVGQCLDHLAVLNEVYLRALAPPLSHQRHAIVSEITPGWLGRWFIRNYVEPTATTRRLRAPRKIKPATQVTPAVLDRFLRSNQEIRGFIERAREYNVNRIRFINPFVWIVRFTIGTGLEILSQHERRHLLQAERVRAALVAVSPTLRDV